VGYCAGIDNIKISYIRILGFKKPTFNRLSLINSDSY